MEALEAWKGGNIQSQGMSISFLVQFSSFVKSCVSLPGTPNEICTHIDIWHIDRLGAAPSMAIAETARQGAC